MFTIVYQNLIQNKIHLNYIGLFYFLKKLSSSFKELQLRYPLYVKVIRDLYILFIYFLSNLRMIELLKIKI